MLKPLKKGMYGKQDVHLCVQYEPAESTIGAFGFSELFLYLCFDSL